MNQSYKSWELSKNDIVAIHKWLDWHYGKPKTCVDKQCTGKSQTFDWCLKTGYKYERNRDNFQRMCRSCHRKYDLTPEKREQAIKNLWWKQKNPVSATLGKTWTWHQNQ